MLSRRGPLCQRALDASTRSCKSAATPPRFVEDVLRHRSRCLTPNSWPSTLSNASRVDAVDPIISEKKHLEKSGRRPPSRMELLTQMCWEGVPRIDETRRQTLSPLFQHYATARTPQAGSRPKPGPATSAAQHEQSQSHLSSVASGYLAELFLAPSPATRSTTSPPWAFWASSGRLDVDTQGKQGSDSEM